MHAHLAYTCSPAISWPACICTACPPPQVCFIFFFSLTNYYMSSAHLSTTVNYQSPPPSSLQPPWPHQQQWWWQWYHCDRWHWMLMRPSSIIIRLLCIFDCNTSYTICLHTDSDDMVWQCDTVDTANKSIYITYSPYSMWDLVIVCTARHSDLVGFCRWNCSVTYGTESLIHWVTFTWACQIVIPTCCLCQFLEHCHNLLVVVATIIMHPGVPGRGPLYYIDQTTCSFIIHTVEIISHLLLVLWKLMDTTNDWQVQGYKGMKKVTHTLEYSQPIPASSLYPWEGRFRNSWG